jgi:hypothetical protein
VPAIQPLQIIERWVTQCYGGIQVMYLCRPHFVSRYDAPGFATELVKILEVELAPLPEDIAEVELG